MSYFLLFYTYANKSYPNIALILSVYHRIYINGDYNQQKGAFRLGKEMNPNNKNIIIKKRWMIKMKKISRTAL